MITNTKFVNELKDLKALAKRIPQAQQVRFVEVRESRGYISVYFGFGSGNVTVGFEKFKGRSDVFMFMHCILPKRKLDIENALTCMEITLHRFPKIEIYYGEDLQKDYNNSRTYDPVTHVIVEKHLMKRTREPELHALQPIERILAEFEGTEKSRYKSGFKKIDYDQAFQNL